MKLKNQMSELDSLYNHILKSHDLYDFQVRFNYMLSIIMFKFETEINKPNHLLFNSHIFIKKMNNELNSIITKLNKSQFLEDTGVIAKDIFILIIKEDFPEYYKNYIYQLEYIKN